ncbi:MAG: beta-propeller domain-containing protein [Bacillota bacterium]
MRRKAVFIVLVIAAVIFSGQYFHPRQSVAQQPKKFTGARELAEYIRANSQLAGLLYGGGRLGGASPAVRPFEAGTAAGGAGEERKMEAAPLSQAAGDSHSTTNVQVEGVDEADILKNDGKYLYVASENQVHILEAYPADRAGLLSSIKCRGYVAEMFLSKDRIMVISRAAWPGMAAEVYDIADRSRPVLVKTLSWDGGYAASRMIESRVYLVINFPVYFREDRNGGESVNLPGFTENGIETVIPPEEIHYFDFPDHSYAYTMIAAVNMEDEKQNAWHSTYLTGASQNVYCSRENLYLTGPKVPDLALLTGRFLEGLASLVDGGAAGRIRGIAGSADRPDLKIQQAEQFLEEYIAAMDYSRAVELEERIRLMRDKFNRDLARERNKTAVLKFTILGSSLEYRSRGEVNGTLLNQFSMDEEGGYLRVATTSQGFLFAGRQSSRNNIYIMDEKLEVVGRIEGLAPTERIFSARFMGGRVYLVTFRNIDPLFVIDIADPKNPKVLGELKIPGFSDYLHPYDENHIIGIGKEAAPAPEPVPLPIVPPRRPASEIMPPVPVRQQGVKIALFDVSDPTRPVEKSKYIVDHKYSDTEVSRNHRAFLFSRSRNIMALPVTYPENRSGGREKKPYYGHWQGMYIFNVSPEIGIALKGKISHSPVGNQLYEGPEPVKRAAYIGEVFYTVSNRSVKLSSMEDLKEIKTVRLPAADNTGEYIKKVVE